MIQTVKDSFEKLANESTALKWEKYMKFQFKYYGVMAEQRKAITKPYLVSKALPTKEKAFELVYEMWQEPHREFQYFAMDLLFKYVKKLMLDDLGFFETLILQQSWWDSVDFLATKMVGAYFLKFPEKRYDNIDRWINSENIWMQRTAVIFQLKYKQSLDTELLAAVIEPLAHSEDRFIVKAIGWILREYSKINPEWVKEYVEFQKLKPASTTEALKFINK